MSYPLLSVTIDTQAAPALKKLAFEHISVMQLPIGEASTVLVLAADGQVLAVRYMPAGELFGLIREQRLLPQMLRLRERSPWAYLLIDGVLTPSGSGKCIYNGNQTGYDWAAVQGALISVQELGVSMLTLQGERYLADAIFTLARRERGTKRLRPPREALFVSPAEDLLLALPGIGDERCAALLRFTGGNGAAALDALTDPTIDIPGIPRRVKQDTRAALGLTSNAIKLGLIGLQDQTYDQHQHEQPRSSNDTHAAAVAADSAGRAA